MTDAEGGALPPGKVPAALLDRLLGGMGPLPPEVLVGPGVGEDACAIQLEGGVLVAASDPITFSGEGLGASAVLVNANDVAVTGARPRWFLATVLLPVGATAAELERVFAGMRAALAPIGAALVGGHTEVTAAVGRPLVAGHMLGLAPRGRVIRTGGVGPGDAIVQAGPAPIEGAAVLAAEGGDRLAAAPGRSIRAAAAALTEPGISVVHAALAAADLGASAMHDPTEGGLAAALWEMATASGVALMVDRGRIRWFAPGLDVCRALGADPMATLASGALLAAFPAAGAEAAVRRLTAGGHEAAVIATAEPGTGVRDTTGAPIPWPARDEIARLLDPGA